MLINIALAQMTSVDNFEKNLQQIADLVTEAARQPADKKPEIIFFPENSLYFRIRADEKLPELLLKSNIVLALEKISRETNIKLHVTSGFFDNGKMWNATILVVPNESATIIYKKIHLFDITLNGEKAIRESDIFTHGSEVTDFDVSGFKFGSSICYDLRFSELYYHHGINHVDAIVVPAAFLVKTGRVHWEVLLRARAIENQCYVIAPAQTGTHNSTKTAGDQRETFGNSMLVSPWGEVLQIKTEGVGLIYGQLNKADSSAVRAQIPMKNHRRIKP